MMKINDRHSKLKEPNLPNTDNLASKYGFKKIIKLNYNENLFGTTPKLKKSFWLKSPNLYPEHRSPKLIKRLSELYQIPEDCFYVSNGSDAILDLVPTLFTSSQTNQNIIIPSLTYSRIETTANVNGIKVIKIPLVDGKIDLKKTKEIINSKTSIIYLVNPNMPTGVAFSFQELIIFLNDIPKHILVVIDEAYAEYEKGVKQLLIDDKNLIRDFDNIIITHTFSKFYGLAAFRIGYFIANPKIVTLFNRAAQYLPLNQYSIDAAALALSDIAFYENVRKKINIEKELIYDKLKQLNLTFYYSKTNFIYIHIPNKNAQELMKYILSTQGILIRPIGDEAIRVTIGKPSQNQKWLRALKEWHKLNLTNKNEQK